MTDKLLPTLTENELLQLPGVRQQLLEEAREHAKNTSMLPSFFHHNVGGCLCVMHLAARWNLPFIQVAGVSYVVNGRLSFQSHLVRTILNQGYLEDDFTIEHFGPWGRIQGKSVYDYPLGENGQPDKSKRKRNMPAWTADAERGLSVLVTARLKNSPKSQSIRINLSDVLPMSRFSTLWVTDPMTQIAYLAMRRWATRFCPQAVMGAFSPEEDIVTATYEDEVKDTRSASDIIQTAAYGDKEIIDVVAEPAQADEAPVEAEPEPDPEHVKAEETVVQPEPDPEPVKEAEAVVQAKTVHVHAEPAKASKKKAAAKKPRPPATPKPKKPLTGEALATALHEQIDNLETPEEIQQTFQVLEDKRAELGGTIHSLTGHLQQRHMQVRGVQSVVQFAVKLVEDDKVTEAELRRVEDVIKSRSYTLLVPDIRKLEQVAETLRKALALKEDSGNTLE